MRNRPSASLRPVCGRFALNETGSSVASHLHATRDFDSWAPTFSIAPTATIPLVRERARSSGEIERTVEPAIWDFWPQWMSADKKKRPQFNTRLKTAATLGLWKKASASTRCVLPMTGYFEWVETPDKKKQPYWIHGTGQLLAAGIYTPRKDEAGDWFLTCSMLTREACDASGELHDRMPAFLTPDLIDEWLNPAHLDAPSLDDLLAELTNRSEAVASTITTHPVDRRMNNHRAIDPHDPTLIASLD